MPDFSPLEVVEDGSTPTAIWAKPDPDHPILAIIGIQETPSEEPYARSWTDLIANG